MSEFTVRLRTWLCPYWERAEHAQQFLCRLSFLVVASSCPENPLLEKTFSPEVVFTSLFSGDWKSLTFLVKRENSSSLLVVYLAETYSTSMKDWFHSLTCTSRFSGWFFQTFFLVGYPKQTVFNIENSVMSNKDTLTIFFSVIYYFQSRNKERKASPDFQPRFHADVCKTHVREKIKSHLNPSPPHSSDCCFTFFPCTQKNLFVKFGSFFHSVTISPKKNHHKRLHLIAWGEAKNRLLLREEKSKEKKKNTDSQTFSLLPSSQHLQFVAECQSTEF